MVPLEQVTLALERYWDPIAHLTEVATTPELRASYPNALAKVVQFDLRLSQSKPIFDVLIRYLFPDSILILFLLKV